MDASPLAKLPAELRNEIYIEVLSLSSDIVIKPSVEHPLGKRLSPKRSIWRPEIKATMEVPTSWPSLRRLGILKACKQLRDECLPIFHSCELHGFDTRSEQTTFNTNVKNS